MNIGQAAQASGISAKMIRYYEIDRPVAAGRPHRRRLSRLRIRPTCSGCALFAAPAILGSPSTGLRDLLKLWSDEHRHSADVKSLALAHIGELESRAAELRGMIKTLRTLVRACEGDHRPDCPIIEELGAAKPSAAAPTSS